MTLAQANTWTAAYDRPWARGPSQATAGFPTTETETTNVPCVKPLVLGQFVIHWYLTNADIKIYYLSNTTSM